MIEFTSAGLIHLFIAVGLAVHAMKTGRSQWWLFILLFVPLIGSIAYVAIELIPAMVRSRGAQKVRGNLESMIDPDKEWRERLKQAELVDSVDAKRALAAEYEKKGLWAEAAHLYQTAASGIFADDPALLTGLARAQLGERNPAAALATLEKLQKVSDGARRHEPHLLYARALEASGHEDEALREYEEVARSYPGFEARARFALLLSKKGRAEEARNLFQEVIRASNARPVAITPADKDWIRVAKANLR
jgi:hypothetical protein